MTTIINDSLEHLIADTCQVPAMLNVATSADTARHDFHIEEVLEHQGFFAQHDSAVAALSHLGHIVGVVGDPVPYTVKGDSIISLILVACFVATVFSLSQSMPFIVRQQRSFFSPLSAGKESDSTGGALRFLVLLGFVTSVTFAVASYLYATENISSHFIFGSEITVIAIVFGLLVAYFTIKVLLYTLVNLVLFDSNRNLQILHTFFFLTAAEGVLLFPVLLLMVYFGLPVEKATYYFVSILIMNKLLAFYKSWRIFFCQNGGVLQTFLYFCALEIVPLLAFCGIWLITIDLVKINF